MQFRSEVGTSHSDQVSPVSNTRRTIAVVLAGFCAFLDLHAPQPLLPELARVFHKSPGHVSFLMTITTLAVALAAPFVGSISDRWGRKRIIVPATLLLAVPTLLAATSASFGQLVFWRFWQGVFTPAVFAVTVTYINEEWGKGAGAMSAYVSGTVLGGFVGRSLAAVVAAHFAWQWAFIVLGVLNVLGGLAIWAWLPRESQMGRRASEGMISAMWQHLRNPRLLATYAAGFCVLFSLLGTFTYVNFYLSAPPFDLSTGALGLIFVVYLVGAVLTPLSGRWIDRLGHRVAFSLAMLLAIAGCLMTLAHNLVAVISGLAIFCTGVFIVQSAASSFIGTAAKSAKAAAVGLYVTFYYVGGSFGAAVPGATWSWGGWSACVGLMVAVGLATVALVWFSWPPKTANVENEDVPEVPDLEVIVSGSGD
jgi:MFS transporter, YNFM family, putative membrane transport protein